MILTLFLCFIFTSTDLQYFLDKDLRIFLSGANHVFLGFKADETFLSARSKYSDLKGFNTLSRVVRDGEIYRIKIGADYLCANSDRAVKCGQNHKWQIIERPFGYNLKQNSKCLTLFSKTYLKMMSCTDSNDQIFDFKYANEDQVCGSSPEVKPEDPKKENVFVFNIDKKVLSKRHISSSEETSSGFYHYNSFRNDFIDLTGH